MPKHVPTLKIYLSSIWKKPFLMINTCCSLISYTQSQSMAQSNEHMIYRKSGDIQMGLVYPGNQYYGLVTGFFSFKDHTVTNMTLNNKPATLKSDIKLNVAMGFDVSYFFVPKASLSVSPKYWMYTYHWDLDGRSETGHEMDYALPIMFRYEFLKKKWLSFKVGLGMEFARQKWSNIPVAIAPGWWSIFSSNSNWDFYTDDGVKNYSNLAETVHAELLLNANITPKCNLEFMLRAGDGSNLNLLQLNASCLMFHSKPIRKNWN